MNRVFLILLAVGGLAACASQERAEPPAPIVTAGRPPASPAQAQPAAPPPPEETVEVYAYRPPSTAPDAAAAPGSVPAQGGLMSESATTTGAMGDTAYGDQSAPASEVPPAGTTTAPASQTLAYAPPPPAPTLSPATDSLMSQAEQQRQAKDYVGAAATLERALGIQPQEAHIWNRLARVRMEQGLYAQAGNLASRSNALAGDQAALKQDNWSMIAAARRAVGDTAGAMEAERKARGG